jgi:hypothetical protein
MLFAYKYVPHQMEKMQEFIDFIFHEVWCKAPDSRPFSLDLFDGSPELREVMHDFYFAEPQPKGAEFFYDHIEGIYGHFAALNPAQIDQFTRWYRANNDIEKACANDPALQLARYTDITPLHKDLSEQLAAFFKGLYSQQLLDLVVLRNKIGDIDNHYQHFMQANTSGKCPFCGIGDVKGIHHTKREAYDHYLPKGLYPFNSINFRNLAPACHECNSTYKLTKDPVHCAEGKRKAFYPYATNSHNIDIRISLGKSDIGHLRPVDIELEFGPAAFSEEIATWKDVYGIEERYKAKCCGVNDGKGWIIEIIDESANYNLTPQQYLEGKLKTAKHMPLVDTNFLRKPFLEACKVRGLFD